MKDLIKNLIGIFKHYNIQITETDLTKRSGLNFLEIMPDYRKIKDLFLRKYHKKIDVEDALEMEVLLLTFQYINKKS